MRRILLIIGILVVIPNTLYANWTLVSKEEGFLSFYVDFTRIKKDGEYVYFWQREEYDKRQKPPRLSALVFFQIDCSIKRWKHLSNTFYSKQNLKGNSLPTSPSSKWKYAQPGSVLEGVFDTVCLFAK